MMLDILLRYQGLVVEEYTLGQEIYFFFIKVCGLLIFFGLAFANLMNVLEFLGVIKPLKPWWSYKKKR